MVSALRILYGVHLGPASFSQSMHKEKPPPKGANIPWSRNEGTKAITITSKVVFLSLPRNNRTSNSTPKYGSLGEQNFHVRPVRPDLWPIHPVLSHAMRLTMRRSVTRQKQQRCCWSTSLGKFLQCNQSLRKEASLGRYLQQFLFLFHLC